MAMALMSAEKTVSNETVSFNFFMDVTACFS